MSLFLWAISAVCAGLYGLWLTHQPPGAQRSVIKTIPVALLACLSALGGGPVFLTVALVLGALGDFFLSRSGPQNFLAGLGSFLLGHGFFIVVFAQAGLGAEVLLQEPWRIAALAGIIGAAAVIFGMLRRDLGEMKLPVLAYMLVICAMGGAALSLPLQAPLGFAVLGAGMFIASDAILAFQLFLLEPSGSKLRWPGTVLWFLYWGGQSIITAALLT